MYIFQIYTSCFLFYAIFRILLYDLDKDDLDLIFLDSTGSPGFNSSEAYMTMQNFFENCNDTERCFLIGYLLSVLISSIVGDTIILIASTRYNALKLNKFILAIIHHISICDLITDISNLLPILTALWTKGWVLGEFLTRVSAFLAGWSYLLSNILVVILTCSKFFLVKFPQKTRNWSNKKAHIVCIVSWLAFLPLFLPMIIPGLNTKILLNCTAFVSCTSNTRKFSLSFV